ncbi:hypothetical protein SJ022_25935, partial [Escherichia coli]|uniref:hypothetical protein n=1 Tax=Escherichia coli TaxID=562 RepID=UPI0029D42EB3
MILEILQDQQVTIAQLQNKSRAPNRIESDPSRKVQRGTNPELIKILEELTIRVKSGEKKIEVNDKKVETYNSRVDQILGAPP